MKFFQNTIVTHFWVERKNADRNIGMLVERNDNILGLMY